MRKNLSTSLRRRARGNPMQAYDRLPPDLRRWLVAAALPWSPRSVLPIWRRLTLECGGDLAAMYRRMDLAERRMLAKDAPRIWGAAHPSCQGIKRS